MENFVKRVFVAVSGVLVLILALLSVSASAAEFQKIKPDELKKMIESKKADFLVVDVQPKGGLYCRACPGSNQLALGSGAPTTQESSPEQDAHYLLRLRT